jgi:hypothetical protein
MAAMEPLAAARITVPKVMGIMVTAEMVADTAVAMAAEVTGGIEVE